MTRCALRYQSGVLLADELARDYAWALESARAVYPELCETRAGQHMEDHTLLVQPILTRIAVAWRAGRHRTGNADVDAILGQAGIASIASFEHIDLFNVTLTRRVNARALADAMNDTGYAIAYPNTIGQLEGQKSFMPFSRDIVIDEDAVGVTLSFFHDRRRCAVTIGYDGSVGDKEKL